MGFRLRRISLLAGPACLALLARAAAQPQSGSKAQPQSASKAQPRSVGEVIDAYQRAVGGLAAIERIQSREVRGTARRSGHLTYYWTKPNLVLMITAHQKIGFDGRQGFVSTRKKGVHKLGRHGEIRLEINANPLRYVHLKEMYSELSPAPIETVDGRAMDLVVAPNNLGTAKFYFDAATHLLRRIEETGETSAYYKTSTDFLKYKSVDELQFPFQIVHATTEPGGWQQDFRVSGVTENIALNPEIFSKPHAHTIILSER